MKSFKFSVAFIAISGAACVAANAATLIDDTTQGLYNSGIGTALDGTNKYGNYFMFPTANTFRHDPTFDIPAENEPDLSTASTALGNWLANPAAPGGSWSTDPMAIPFESEVNTETAIIYKLDGGASGLSNVMASFGVDNGIYVWLNGTFLGGHLSKGGVTLGEFTLALGDLAAGDNYLQILREDHGGETGYAVSVTGDLTGDNTPAPVPLPASGLLLLAGAGGLAAFRRKQKKAA